MPSLDRAGSGAYRIVFRHHAVYRPSEHEASDERRLGFAVRSIRFRPLPPEAVIEAPSTAGEPSSPPPPPGENEAEAVDGTGAPPPMEANISEAIPPPAPETREADLALPST